MSEGFKSPEKKQVTPRSFDSYLEHFRFSEEDLAKKNILDVGSGLSNFSKIAAETFKDAGTIVVALDPTYSFMNKGFDAFKDSIGKANMEINPIGMKVNPVSPDFRIKQRFEEVKSHTTNVAGSHQELPFAPGSFDLVLSHNSILNYEDRNITRNALMEISNVLKGDGEVRLMPANLTHDKQGNLYMYTFEAPTPETMQEAKDLDLEIGPDRKTFSVFRDLEEAGHTFYAVPPGGRARPHRVFRMAMLPENYVLIMRRDSHVPHVTGVGSIYRLSFKDSSDGFHVPSELIPLESRDQKEE